MQIMFTEKANKIFQEVIATYHIKDDPYQSFENKYDKENNVLVKK